MMMNTKILLTLTLILFTTAPQAALFSRGGGTMVYDDVLNVTWLADVNHAQTSGHDADGLMSWDAAVAWADGLSFGGKNDWRLPGFTGATTCIGFNCTDSEYGHMFYNNLGATAGNSILDGSNLANLALFSNV
jgi:hypothetical protein